MSAIFELNNTSYIEQEIALHPAWLGRVSGLAAEKLLRGKNTPYLFVLRAGELENDYYVTFVAPDMTIKHTPFVIITTSEGWCYNNGGAGGPYKDGTIEDVLYQIMHCEKGENTPFINFKKDALIDAFSYNQQFFLKGCS